MSFTPQASAQIELTQHYPQPGWVEHDAEDIWSATLEVCRKAIAAVGGAANIAAIGITNQRETTIVWDRKTGAPVHRAIVWQDRRTAEACAALRQAVADGRKGEGSRVSRFGPDPQAFFNEVYRDTAPWDVGGPQPALESLFDEFPPEADLAAAIRPGGRYYLLEFAVTFPVPNSPLEVTEAEVRSRFSRGAGWEILALRHFQEMAYQEIADTLEIPIGTVMSRLFHARRRLKERLEPHL